MVNLAASLDHVEVSNNTQNYTVRAVQVLYFAMSEKYHKMFIFSLSSLIATGGIVLFYTSVLHRNIGLSAVLTIYGINYTMLWFTMMGVIELYLNLKSITSPKGFHYNSQLSGCDIDILIKLKRRV